MGQPTRMDCSIFTHVLKKLCFFFLNNIIWTIISLPLIIIGLMLILMDKIFKEVICAVKIIFMLIKL